MGSVPLTVSHCLCLSPALAGPHCDGSHCLCPSLHNGVSLPVVCRYPEETPTPKFYIMIYEHQRLMKKYGMYGTTTGEIIEVFVCACPIATLCVTGSCTRALEFKLYA